MQPPTAWASLSGDAGGNSAPCPQTHEWTRGPKRAPWALWGCTRMGCTCALHLLTDWRSAYVAREKGLGSRKPSAGCPCKNFREKFSDAQFSFANRATCRALCTAAALGLLQGVAWAANDVSISFDPPGGGILSEGESVTVTVAGDPATSQEPIPAGSVNLTFNGTALGDFPLTNGKTQPVPMKNVQAFNTLKADYGGDTCFYSAKSSTTTYFGDFRAARRDARARPGASPARAAHTRTGRAAQRARATLRPR